MPQKKNPDIAELVRGKTGRVYGALMSLLTTMKGLPLAYNKDMQEDKEFVFDAIDTTKGCLALFTGMLKTMKFNKERMEENLAIWDFSLDSEDMAKIAALDKGCPSMLDSRKISEVRRVYDYLNNPVLTSL